MGNNNDDDNKGGDMPSWMFKKESNRGKTKNKDSNKNPAQIKRNDNHATEDIKVQGGTTEETCVAGLVLTRAQAKKSYKNHPEKVKEATCMSSVDKTTIEDLQKRDSSLKKCFERVGKPIIRENYVGEFFMKKGLLFRKHEEMKTGRSSNQLIVRKELRQQVISVNHESAFSGHLGVKKTKVRIIPNFFWPGLCQDIIRF